MGTIKRGRPRSEEADCAIVKTALKLLKERGYYGLTMEAVARGAGVGRPTLYRRWPSKAALVLDSYLCNAERKVPIPDTGSIASDVRLFLRRLFRALGETKDGQILARFVADAQSDPKLLRLFRERLIQPRRNALRTLLERGVSRGELSPTLDLEIMLDLLYGPMWYRLLVKHGPLDRAYADALVQSLVQTGIFKSE